MQKSINSFTDDLISFEPCFMLWSIQCYISDNLCSADKDNVTLILQLGTYNY